MAWEIFEDIWEKGGDLVEGFVESITKEGTPIDDIKKANKEFKDMWYEPGTLLEKAKETEEGLTIKDYYDKLHEINAYEPQYLRADKGLKEESRKNLVADLDIAFPDRNKGDAASKFHAKYQTPFFEKGRPFVDSDVTEAILRGKMKLPPPEYTGPFGKLGEYFSKNAAARDKLFSMMGSMGRELVKPIQPGQEAAGALVPTLSRGLGKGEEEYAAKQAAGAKTALDIASARQKISPLQYYSSKMQEARLAVPKHIGPDTAEGKRWIGKYLMSVGMPSQVVDLTSSLDSLKLQLLSAPSDAEKKRLQGLMDQISRQIQDLVSQGIGGSSVTSFIPYSP